MDDIEFLPGDESGAIATLPEIISAKGYAKHVDIYGSRLPTQP